MEHVRQPTCVELLRVRQEAGLAFGLGFLPGRYRDVGLVGGGEDFGSALYLSDCFDEFDYGVLEAFDLSVGGG